MSAAELHTHARACVHTQIESEAGLHFVSSLCNQLPHRSREMQQLLSGMVDLRRPAPTEPADWPNCGRAGEAEEEGERRRKGD